MKSIINKETGFVTGHGGFEEDHINGVIEETEAIIYEKENPTLVERESTYSKPVDRGSHYQISFANRENRAGTQAGD
jgi:hypothetical protein